MRYGTGTGRCETCDDSGEDPSDPEQPCPVCRPGTARRERSVTRDVIAKISSNPRRSSSQAMQWSAKEQIQNAAVMFWSRTQKVPKWAFVPFPFFGRLVEEVLLEESWPKQKNPFVDGVTITVPGGGLVALPSLVRGITVFAGDEVIFDAL